MNSPTTPVFAITGGKGRHAGDHGRHLEQMHLEYFAIDTSSNHAIKPNGAAINYRGDMQNFLRSNETPLGVIIASPDEEHMRDLEACIGAGVKYILDEKTMALNVADLQRFHELMSEAGRNGTRITTCLPRITDTRYRQLISMMPGLIEKFGKVTSISHSFTSQNTPRPGSSAGRDHFVHEITMLLNILGCTDDIDIQIDIDTINDAPSFYFCGGKIGEVLFDVSGEKDAGKNEERVGIDFQDGSEVHFSTQTGKIQIIGEEERNVDLVEGNPAARLMEITRNFVRVALGHEKNFYLPDNLFLASAEFPATIFPNQEVAS